MKTIPFRCFLLLGLFIILNSPFQSSAQENEPYMPAKFSDRIFFGGNFGLQFGDLTLIDISPMVGYRFTEKVAAGVSVSYKYYHFKNFFYNPASASFADMKSNIYGAGIFGRYYFVENIFAHVEYEYLIYSYDSYRLNSTASAYVKTTEKVEVPGLFLGGGYRQPVGGRVYFSILILYNVNESPYSPYSNPIIRAGVSVGL